MTKEKKEFTWDTETIIGGFSDGKARFEVSINELNDKLYVQATKYVQTKAGEKRAKNFTLPLKNLDQLNNLITDWKMESAFGSTSGNIEAPKKDLPLKMSPVATLRGKKLTLEERLQQNPNFAGLSAGKRELLLDQVRTAEEETGMVSVGISKANFTVVEGLNKVHAEARIKGTKGFTRAEVTYIG